MRNLFSCLSSQKKSNMEAQKSEIVLRRWRSHADLPAVVEKSKQKLKRFSVAEVGNIAECDVQERNNAMKITGRKQSTTEQNNEERLESLQDQLSSIALEDTGGNIDELFLSNKELIYFVMTHATREIHEQITSELQLHKKSNVMKSFTVSREFTDFMQQYVATKVHNQLTHKGIRFNGSLAIDKDTTGIIVASIIAVELEKVKRLEVDIFQTSEEQMRYVCKLCVELFINVPRLVDHKCRKKELKKEELEVVPVIVVKEQTKDERYECWQWHAKDALRLSVVQHSW